ncbi:hypothetical protein HNY73_008309 [Argiope bruennichi]|uniref:Uncharacterized protein n=1 Tax=Argiope bruennichi TaxID=94029 RepID=A0A8T0FB85_ARGBR|nr:hypothetical protein HNY73_008309 [Argiope bruennichi]
MNLTYGMVMCFVASCLEYGDAAPQYGMPMGGMPMGSGMPMAGGMPMGQGMPMGGVPMNTFPGSQYVPPYPGQQYGK